MEGVCVHLRIHTPFVHTYTICAYIYRRRLPVLFLARVAVLYFVIRLNPKPSTLNPKPYLVIRRYLVCVRMRIQLCVCMREFVWAIACMSVCVCVLMCVCVCLSVWVYACVCM